MGHVGMTGRLVSPAGAAFGLVPVPDPWSTSAAPGGKVLVDVELLSPDRLVCYLGRRIPTDALTRLAAAYLRAAADLHPEITVPAVEVPEGGVTVAFVASDELNVTVECTVVEVLGDDVPEHDVLAFDVPRASLVSCSHQLSSWVEDLMTPVEEDA